MFRIIDEILSLTITLETIKKVPEGFFVYNLSSLALCELLEHCGYNRAAFYAGFPFMATTVRFRCSYLKVKRKIQTRKDRKGVS